MSKQEIQQLTIPQKCECARCGLKAENQVSVYQNFGMRLMEGKLLVQAHCKKCRKLHLSKELREKLNQFKTSIDAKYSKPLEEIQNNFKSVFEKLRDEHKFKVEKLGLEKKQAQNKILDTKKELIEKKRIELEGSK